MPLRVFALALFLAAMRGVQAADYQVDPQLAEKWVLETYQPAVRRFAESATQWASSSEDLCGSARGSRLYSLQTTFTQLLTNYGQVDIFRSAPLLNDNLQSRLFYWPDKRRAGERQLRALLADPAIAEFTAQQLAKKSVSVQGFPALERLLFNNQYQAVESIPQCQLVKAIIQNIAQMANQLDRAWQSDTVFVQDFLQPKATSADFRNDTEVLRSVITEVATGLDSLVDRKLQPLLSGDPKNIRTAPFWTSRRTLALLRGNVASIRSLLLNSGLTEQLNLDDDLKPDFDYVDHLIDKLDYKFDFADANGQLHEEFQTVFTTLSAVLNGIRHTVNHQVLVALGMAVNFNANDGD